MDYIRIDDFNEALKSIHRNLLRTQQNTMIELESRYKVYSVLMREISTGEASWQFLRLRG